MRLAPFRLQPGAFLIAEGERGAVIDRRQATRELALALELQLVRRLVAGIEPPYFTQPLRHRVIKRETLRLPHGDVGHDAEPGEIGSDRRRVFLTGALQIRIVESQDEAARRWRRANNAFIRAVRALPDMDHPRRGGGETDFRYGS